MRIPHWGFKTDWWPYNFMPVYDTNIYSSPKNSNARKATTVADKTPNASRARFANLPQRKYIKPKAVLPQRKPVASDAHMAIPFPAQATNSITAVPPNTAILTVPIEPVESEDHTAHPVPSSCVTSPLATTVLIPNKMIDSDVVATPSNTTTSVPSVAANLGPIQPVGPIADTPSVRAPRYILNWTYYPNSESVSFRRVRSNSISFQRSTSSSSPCVRCQDKSNMTPIQCQDKSTVTASHETPSTLPNSAHHSAPPWGPTNLGWTFNPQNAIATFRCVPTSVPTPQPPICHQLLPSATLAEDTDLPHAASAYIGSLHSQCRNQLCSKPYYQPVLRLSKRHRDALTIKMYHLYANILSMNWFYDAFD
eukprot:jgi/Psemu1/6568/gm1.6568_g